MNISISDLKTQNQELNETLQETRESLETSKEKLLLLKQEVDEEKGKWTWHVQHVAVIVTVVPSFNNTCALMCTTCKCIFAKLSQHTISADNTTAYG